MNVDGSPAVATYKFVHPGKVEVSLRLFFRGDSRITRRDGDGGIYHVFVGVASYENSQDKDERQVERGESADRFTSKHWLLCAQ